MEYIIHGGTITVTRIFISDFHLSFNKNIIYIFLRWIGAAACWWRPRWPRLNAHSLTDHCEPKKCNGARDIHYSGYPLDILGLSRTHKMTYRFI